jgi:hypothetical protein
MRVGREPSNGFSHVKTDEEKLSMALKRAVAWCCALGIGLSAGTAALPSSAQPAVAPSGQAGPGENLTLRCPGRVRTLAGQAIDVPAAGFSAVLAPNALAYLTGVAVQEGPPDRRAELPVSRLDGRLHWSIEPQHQRPSLLCQYEGGVALARPLAASTRHCVAEISFTGSRLPEGTGIDHAVAACR